MNPVVEIKRRANSKHMRLSARADGKLILSVPRLMPQFAIKAFLKKHRKWVERHQASLPVLRPGDRIGRQHQLSFTASDKNIKPGVIRIKLALSQDHQQPAIQRRAYTMAVVALKEEASDYLPAVVAKWAGVVGAEPKKVSVKDMRTRWGSYSSNNNLSLAIYLMQLPDCLIDYVVVHELCHKHHMNHSPKFWKKVGEHIPDYSQRRRELKRHKLALAVNT